MIELNAKNANAAVIVPTVKLLLRSTCRSSSGTSTLGERATSRFITLEPGSHGAMNWRATNHMMPSTPISIAHHTIGFVNGYASMLVKPNISPPKPNIDSTTEKKSACAVRSDSPKLCRKHTASSTEATPITVSVRKMERQPVMSVCQPPMVGPSAGATLIAMPTVPIATPRRDSG